MPYPYDHVIRHGWEQGQSPCALCYGQISNRACGKEWCPCVCMEHPSAEADLAPDFMPIDYPDEVDPRPVNQYDERIDLPTKPGPPTWKEEAPLEPLRSGPTSTHVALAFWTGILTASVIAVLVTSDMNGWVRGILIALVALGGMATAGRTMRGN